MSINSNVNTRDMEMTRALHTTNGSSAAGLIKTRLNLVDEALLVMNDLLCCGPLQLELTSEEGLEARQKYWDGLLPLCGLEAFPMQDFPRDFYFNFSDLDSVDEYHIWLGTSLGDQMMLAFLVYFLATRNFDFDKVFVHQYQRMAGKNFEISGIGLLNPEEIEDTQFVERLSNNAVEQLVTCWQTLCSDDIEKLRELIDTPLAELPLFSRSLKSLIGRFPDINSGLTDWDEKLLNAVNLHGPRAVRVVGQVLGETFDSRDLVGDLYLFARLKQLGNHELKQPLVSLDGFDNKMHDTQVVLTEAGEAVLAGKKKSHQAQWISGQCGGDQIICCRWTLVVSG